MPLMRSRNISPDRREKLRERLNEEIKRRTHVVRIFPNTDACLRLTRALAVETYENWLEAHRSLNMNDIKEHKKTALRKAAWATPAMTAFCRT